MVALVPFRSTPRCPLPASSLELAIDHTATCSSERWRFQDHAPDHWTARGVRTMPYQSQHTKVGARYSGFVLLWEAACNVMRAGVAVYEHSETGVEIFKIASDRKSVV